jgi:hypothetical protein
MKKEESLKKKHRNNYNPQYENYDSNDYYNERYIQIDPNKE